jgi:hypothetical protein
MASHGSHDTDEAKRKDFKPTATAEEVMEILKVYYGLWSCQMFNSLLLTFYFIVKRICIHKSK